MFYQISMTTLTLNNDVKKFFDGKPYIFIPFEEKKSNWFFFLLPRLLYFLLDVCGFAGIDN
jgi:hypothetical protein